MACEAAYLDSPDWLWRPKSVRRAACIAVANIRSSLCSTNLSSLFSLTCVAKQESLVQRIGKGAREACIRLNGYKVNNNGLPYVPPVKAGLGSVEGRLSKVHPYSVYDVERQESNLGQFITFREQHWRGYLEAGVKRNSWPRLSGGAPRARWMTNKLFATYGLKQYRAVTRILINCNSNLAKDADLPI